MAARLTRAKQRIATSGTGIELPDDDAVDERLPAVRRVVQLAYALGHTAGAGDHLRDENLAERAVRLARKLHELRPQDPEGAGLLSLVLLSEARATTRLGDDGDQVVLADADRGLWDRPLIEEGLALQRFANDVAEPGPLALQAAIAAEHARATTFDGTRWEIIARLYAQLLSIEPSPTIALGRCVAISYAQGPAAGLADLDEVISVGRLDSYPYAHAARAQMLARLGQQPEARRAWIRAASCARTTAERDFFTTRAAG
jgi:RNA polymerase sigma-70 factor (ECF subfamily)